jgi:predicted nuclease of predicted toxin-antitoxin system
MRFWIDENIERSMSNAVKRAGHETFAAPPKTDDLIILQLALEAHAVILTHDWDFERHVLKERRTCAGVVLIEAATPSRLEELTVKLLRLIKTRERTLSNSFIILSFGQIKIVRLK